MTNIEPECKSVMRGEMIPRSGIAPSWGLHVLGWLTPWTLIQVFENAGCTHPTANAHGDQTIPTLTTFEFADDGRGKFGAGAAQRMSESNGTTVRIDLLRIEPGFLDHCQRLRSKSFVQFDDVNLG